MLSALQSLRRLADRINAVALAMTAAVGLVFLLGGYFFWQHHYANVTRATQETARREADLILLALEHQMQEKERDLIAQMIRSIGRDPTIHQVRIVDRAGRTRFAGGAQAERGVAFPPSCGACHGDTGAGKVRQSADGELFRVVLPIENRVACQRCHEPQHTVNGALILEVRTAELEKAVNRDIGGPIMVIGALAIALLAAMALSFRVLVLKRMEQFEEAARAISEGELQRRLPVKGGDTISWMARAFNAMADSVMRMAGQLQEQRELLEMVINSVDDGIAVLDRRHRFVAANEAFLSRSGNTQLTVPGAHCRDVMGHACHQVQPCPAAECFQSGQRQRTLVTRVGPDGQTRVEELHASPIRSAAGVIAVVEVWRDITERRAAEGRMAQSHRMASLGTLASGFSHEINTPLATTLTCVESILRVMEGLSVPGDERHELLIERARIAREQVLRCRGITQQFLRLSRGQKASTDLLELGPLARAVVRLVEPTAREYNVSVRCLTGEAGEVTVRANDAELQQVLLNLLLNAIQACKAGGEVTVEVDARDLPRLIVRDTGCGIPADQRQKIFEPFYGLRRGGTGLGLFLSVSMARSWGADVEVTSSDERGSTFEVKFHRALAQVMEA